VVAILTRDDFADIDFISGPPSGTANRYWKVRHSGEPVVAVARDGAAESALELIEVEYEELPVVRDLDEALSHGAPILHEKIRLAGQFADLASIRTEEKSNIGHHFHYERGDVQKAFKTADHVFEHLHHSSVYHCNLSLMWIARWEVTN
jgi:2-furoyl-CoA dehydrogenase large subunit